MQEVIAADRIQYFLEIGGGGGKEKGINVQPLTVLTFNAHEEMSRLSRFHLTVWSEEPELAIKDMIRQPATIRIQWDKKSPKEKTFYGIVASVSQSTAGRPGEVEKLYGHYSVEIVPTLWLLGQKSNCKIFQEMPANDIIAAVLDARGMAGKYEMRVGGCRIREFCLQYRETDLAFISRLMEEEGLYYWFEHKGQDKMIIGDSVGGYGECWPLKKAIYRKHEGVISTPESRDDLEWVSDLVYEESAYTGKVAYRDWNYREPEKPPMRPEAAAPDHTDLEIYDYHLERYLDPPSEGQHYAQMAVDAQSAMRKTLSGSGTFRSTSCGSVIEIEKAYRGDLNGEWMIVSMSHSATQTGSTGVDYSVSFTAIPADTTFRPLPRTPAPVLTMQTATVVGPPGAEVYMDEYGRAKVQFHWDLDHSYNPESSCWIRVAMPYAGLNEDTGFKHGFQWHPLIDDEVIVDFLEGDPDNPVIVGSVYNYVKMPPIKPEELIRNMILTRYQHRLLFDDKNKAITRNTPYPHTLHLNDPAKKATLNTRYGHQLEMWDPHDDNQDVPDIELKTGGNEVLRMEDKNKPGGLGNNIKLSTADGHFQHLLEGDKTKGIILQTHDGHFVKLKTDFEGAKGIELQTSQQHRVWMDDVNRTIVVTSKDQHRVEISDKEEKIQIADSSGKHSITIDIGSEKITIATKTGDIDMLAPSGNIKIGAKTIEVLGQDSVDIKARTITEGAGQKLSRESPQVETKGGTVKTTATTLHRIKGLPVRIN